MQATPNINPQVRSPRMMSIDLLRGAVMVLMAIDHVRVYSGIPAGGSSAGIFFTRWITNFCAPAFVFLAGTSALLYGIKLNNPVKLSSYLLSRGLLLVLLELTLIRFFWMFNLDFSNFMLAGVIWMLGWCMVLLAAFVKLRPATIGIIGLCIIFLQQLFHFVPLLLPETWRVGFGRIWEFVYPSGLDGLPGIAILYVLVPWIGVMMAGYGFGKILLMEEQRKKRICWSIGFTAIAIYLVAGILMIIYGPAPEHPRPFLLRLLNQQKYPASQLFLLMTLGPLIVVFPWAERVRGWFVNVLSIFGRVPLFYYILHILLIHISALVVNLILHGNAHQEWYNTAPFTDIAEDQRWSLGLLYLVFIIDVVILYFICRWYAKYKAGHPGNRLLKYL